MSIDLGSMGSKLVYTTFSLLYMNHEDKNHPRILIALRTSARLEDMMTEHKHAWVFPGLFFFSKDRHVDVVNTLDIKQSYYTCQTGDLAPSID